MSRSLKALLLLVAAVSLVAVGCGDDDSDSSATTTEAGGGVTVATETGTPVEVVLGDAMGDDGPMTMEVTPDTVSAGTVTFTVKNEGTVDHEMVVLKTDTPFDQLEVNADNKVSEEDSIGEQGEFGPGETKTLTLDMSAGNYVLVCNIAKHYGNGMRAPFTVT